MGNMDPETVEKLKPFRNWTQIIKDDWKYKQKLVIYQDADGNLVTPTTTTTTTTTAKPIITSSETDKHTHPSHFTSVVVIDSTSVTPRADPVSSATTTELIKIVGITCGSLIGIILLALLVIRLCRKSAAKKRQRVTVRRPLTEAEREEHIYAEIEPLQRPTDLEGASGTSEVQLPQKKHRKRHSGISSFRALSTRIYKFFNVDSDNQSVFYNRNSQRATVSGVTPPEPPERNAANGRQTKKIDRFASTASRRPLLDADSRTETSRDSRDSSSDAAELRGNIYNPLMKETEGRAPSGPYDHLTLSKTQSGNARVTEGEPSSPHDYFTLEKNSRERNPNDYVDSENVESNSVAKDSVIIENETRRGIETITEEEGEVSATPKKHDYFILEPHEREDAPNKTNIKSDNSLITSKDSKPTESPVKDSSPVKEIKSKPEKTPRVTKLGENIGDTKTEAESSTLNSSSPYEVAKNVDENGDVLKKPDEIKRSDSKEETYVLSKFGDAPLPPEVINDEEYLRPKDVARKPDYVDVYPNPPPRSTSLQPHELVGSKEHDKKNDKTHVPEKHELSPKTSPKKTVSKKDSPSHKSVSPTHKPAPPAYKPAPPTHQPVSPTKTVETDI